MNTEIFYKILQNPYTITEEDKDALDAILAEHPYFQVAHILKLQNTFSEEKKYERLLHRFGIQLPDPKHYYRNLMLNKMYTKPTKTEEKTPVSSTNQLKENAQEEKLQYAPSFYQIKEQKQVQEKKENQFFTEWLDTIAQPNSTIESKDSQKESSIPNFVHNQSKELNPQPKAQQKKQNPEQLMSQTLAEIYVKQGLYTKAILIYEKLDLNSSGKNTIFARRIKEINELKNN